MITYAILIILFSFFHICYKILKTAENSKRSYILVSSRSQRSKSTCLHCLKRLTTIGAVFRVYFINSSNCTNSLCTLQAQSRLWHLSDLDFNWYRRYETTRRLPIENVKYVGLRILKTSLLNEQLRGKVRLLSVLFFYLDNSTNVLKLLIELFENKK